jgi:hypothetical protein
MRKVFVILMLLCSAAYAADRVVLQDGSGVEVGTTTNPLKASFSGAQTINGDLTVSGDIYFDNAIGTGSQEEIEFDSAPGVTVKIDGNDFADQSIYIAGTVPGATKLRVDGAIYAQGSGNTGLGTQQPSALLDVGGGTVTGGSGNIDFLVKNNAQIDGMLYVNNVGIGTPINGTAPLIVRSNGTTSSGGIKLYSSGAAGTGSIYLDSSNRLTIDSNGAGTTLVLASPATNNFGNVSIGTNASNAKLQIATASRTSSTGNGLLVGTDIEADGNIYADGSLYGGGTTLGWGIKSAANTACTTTCVRGCVLGWDTASGEVAVKCDSATADKCLCAAN